jgi:solute:Na+ symporter, SSS family
MHDFLSTFDVWDLLIIAAYLVGVVWLGFKVGGRKKGTVVAEGKGTEDYVVGSRKIPWPAVVCSIVATEISAATFIGVPQAAFDGNLNYLQFGIGSLLARFAVASIFIGAFYYFGVLTVYEYIYKRFGPKSRYTATGFFLLGRVLGSGVRLYIATFALAGIFDIPMWVSLILFTLAAMAYTWFGGIKSVIWTGVMQAIVFVGGVIALIIYLQCTIGWGEILHVANGAGKLELFHWQSSHSGLIGWLNDPVIFYIAVLNGFLATTSALGTDQDLTQRMLTCKDAGKARRSVILSGFVGLPITAMFLFVGIGLYVYYTTKYAGGPLPWAASGDTRLVLPHFIGHVLPHGLRGLLVAALFATAMSCVDSTLGALSSAAVVDLYKPFIAPGKSDAHYLKVCRIAVIVFGILVCAVAWYVRDKQDMLWLALQVAAIPGGALLGVFLLGLLTKTRGSDRGNMIAMLTSAVYSSILLYMSMHKWETFGWSWVIVLGATWTVAVGILLDGKGWRKRPCPCNAPEPGDTASTPPEERSR